jgi:hypothetical protein
MAKSKKKQLVPVDRLAVTKASELIAAGVPEGIALTTSITWALQKRSYEVACYQIKMVLQAGSSLAPSLPAHQAVSWPFAPSPRIVQQVRDRVYSKSPGLACDCSPPVPPALSS